MNIFLYILPRQCTDDEVDLIYFITSALDRCDKHAHGLITSVLGRRGYLAYHVGPSPTWFALDPSTSDVIHARCGRSDLEGVYCCSENVGAKKSGPNVASIFNEARSRGFKRKCNYCPKFGHKKIDCHKLKANLEKKGNPFVKVCLESNIIDVPTNSWWLDTGATIHVTNLM